MSTNRSVGIEVVGSGGEALILPAHVTDRAVSIGSEGEVVIPGVAPRHLLVVLRSGRLYATSSETDANARTHDGAEATSLFMTWMPLVLPCEVVLGSVVIRMAWCSPRIRRATPPSAFEVKRPSSTRRLGPLPRPQPPPRREFMIPDAGEDPTLPRRRPEERLDDTTIRAQRPTVNAPSVPPQYRAPPVQSFGATGQVRSQGALFDMASRAVDAWNRFVDNFEDTR